MTTRPATSFTAARSAGNVHVVEQKRVGIELQRLVELVEVGHLDLDLYHVAGMRARALERRRRRHRRRRCGCP